MKRNFLSLLIMMMLFAVTSSAQRVVDKLDRGLVAVQTTKGVFVSWRIQSEEYQGVTYNLYRNGTKIAEKLNVRPPFVTLVTRLMLTSLSFNSRSLVRTLFVFAISLRI